MKHAIFLTFPTGTDDGLSLYLIVLVLKQKTENDFKIKQYKLVDSGIIKISDRKLLKSFN